MNNELQPSPHRVARLLTAGLAVAGTLGAGAIVDHAEHGWPFNQSNGNAATTNFTPAPANPNITVTLPGEITSNKSETAQKMIEDTVELENMGCSGTLIDDETGTAVAVETNGHCLGNFPLPIVKGSDGLNYLVHEPIMVKKGTDHQNTVGTVDRFIVSAAGDSDIAVGLFAGADESKVRAVEEAKAPVKEPSPGDTFRFTGFPADPQNRVTILPRQEFTSTVLGWQKNWSDDGRQVDVLWTALPEGSPACSRGTSGGGAYTTDAKGNIAADWRVAGYFDFAGNTTGIATADKESIRNFYAQLLNADLSEVPGICALVPNRLSANNTVINVVQKLTDIPGQTDDGTAITLSRG